MAKTPISLKSLTIILIGFYVILDAIYGSVLTLCKDMRLSDQILATVAVAIVSGCGILLVLRKDFARRMVIAWSVVKSALILSKMFCVSSCGTCPVGGKLAGVKAMDPLNILMLIGYLSVVYFLTRPLVKELFKGQSAV